MIQIDRIFGNSIWWFVNVLMRNNSSINYSEDISKMYPCQSFLGRGGSKGGKGKGIFEARGESVGSSSPPPLEIEWKFASFYQNDFLSTTITYYFQSGIQNFKNLFSLPSSPITSVHLVMPFMVTDKIPPPLIIKFPRSAPVDRICVWHRIRNSFCQLMLYTIRAPFTN